MDTNRTLYVGLDLCDDFSQLSLYNDKTFEPDSICPYEKEVSLIPTVLGVKEATGEWLIGEEALTCSKEKEGIHIDHILRTVMEEKNFKFYDIEFTGVQILEKFLRKTLRLLKKQDPDGTIAKLTVTIKEMNMKLIQTIYEALKNLGIERDRMQVMSHEQCYLYYALSQKKELWMNDIGLFDFDETGLSYHQISINRRNTPMVVGVNSQDLQETLNYELCQEHVESASYIFENVAKSILQKEIISTVYITGKGFEGDWANPVLKELCVGRRLFVGQNLYSKGACYASREQAARENPGIKEKLGGFLFLSREMITCDITMKVYYNAKETEILLAKAGIPWYDVDCRLDLIPDYEEELELMVKDVLKRTKTYHMMKLEEIKGRENRTTRLGFHLRFVDEDTCVVTVKDKGFGEFYPTTNRIWEKTIFVGK